jgi:hypothetical protein
MAQRSATRPLFHLMKPAKRGFSLLAIIPAIAGDYVLPANSQRCAL